MIDYPVRFTEDYQIVDRYNRTVIPDLLWKGDLDHKKRQKEVGELVARLLNEHLKPVRAQSNGDSEDDESTGSYNAKVRNPWGRAGKPK